MSSSFLCCFKRTYASISRGKLKQPKRNTLSSNVGRHLLPKSSVLPKGSDSVTSTLAKGTKFAVLSEVSRQQRINQRNVITKVLHFSQLKLNTELRAATLAYIALQRGLNTGASADPADILNLLKNSGLSDGHPLSSADFDKLSQFIDSVDKSVSPTPIQKIALKAILTSHANNPLGLHQWLFAAETGSGKTLAYLLPMFSRILERKAKKTNSQYDTAINGADAARPRVSVILVPTIDLVHQVSNTLSFFSKYLPISTFALTPDNSYKMKSLPRKLGTGQIDILVATPERLKSSVPTSFLNANCDYVVVDEADTLMDDTFRPETESVLSKLDNLDHLIFCSATIPRKFDRVLRDNYPNIGRLVTPKIHRLPTHIDFKVVEVFRPPYNDRKDLALHQALYAIYHDNSERHMPCKRVVVFVNKKDAVRPLVDKLKDAGFDAIGVDKSVKSGERRKYIEDFIKAETATSAELETPSKKPSTPASTTTLKVLVCTDLLARGIDMHRIKNVILFDVPRSSADMLHRAGRTGRLGARGRVLLFVNKAESESWVKGLDKVARKGLAFS